MFGLARRLLERNNKRTQKLIHRRSLPGETNPLSQPQDLEKGVLYIVSTPIGNLKDFSIRALDVLKNTDYIACYNLNNTRLLMEIIDMPSRGRLVQIPYENAYAVKKLVNLLDAGHSMALVSNAGTPMVGDPTGLLVHSVQRAKYRVTCVPGPCSILAALTVSGLDFSSCGFRFIGYVSHISSIRKKQLKDSLLHGQSSVCVMFETPPRLLGTLKEIAILCPTRRVSVVHEVTKMHEAVHCQEALTLFRFYERSGLAQQKMHGEIVLCVDSYVETTGITSTHYGTFNELEILEHFKVLSSNGQSDESALLITATNLNIPMHVVKRIIENKLAVGTEGEHIQPSTESSEIKVAKDPYLRESWQSGKDFTERAKQQQSLLSKEILSPSEKRRIVGHRRRRAKTALKEQMLLLKYKKAVQQK